MAGVIYTKNKDGAGRLPGMFCSLDSSRGAERCRFSEWIHSQALAAGQVAFYHSYYST